MPDDTDSLLSVRDVTKRYGEVTALDGVSLSVAPGEVRCLVGPNGSGKTTLFALVAGLAHPDAGEVVCAADRVGYGFQSPACYDGLTVSENLDVFAPASCTPARRRGVVSNLDLGAVGNRLAGDLSGGFRKRLDLALALLSDPDLLVLDEPLAGLDEATKRRLLAVLRADHGPDRGVLVVTHHVGAFEEFADSVTVLDGGSVVATADVETLSDRAGTLHAAYLDVLGVAADGG
jgi:ABC-2 type transport system ATP-binding protein